MSRRRTQRVVVPGSEAGPPLLTRPLTPKQEAFARTYVETGCAYEAYKLSYDVAEDCKRNTIDRRAHELMQDGKITARIYALRAKAAERHEITVEKLSDMALEAYRAAAKAPTPQASAMIKATEFLGKLHGLVIERKETGKPGEFARMSDEDLERVISDARRERGEGIAGTTAGARLTH